MLRHAQPSQFPYEYHQIQGATSHYDAVVSAVTGGVLHASTDSGKFTVPKIIQLHNYPGGVRFQGRVRKDTLWTTGLDWT